MATLIHDQKAIKIRTDNFGSYTGEKFLSQLQPDLSIFTESELLTLALVKDKFKDFSAKEMREFSHREKGYRETSSGNLISFEYSNYLQI